MTYTARSLLSVRSLLVGLSINALVLVASGGTPAAASSIQASNTGPANATPAVASQVPQSVGSPNGVLGPECYPHLVATKTASLFTDADHDGVVSPGETLAYKINILNNGDAPATGVVFSDTFQANLLLVTGSVTTTRGTIVRG